MITIKIKDEKWFENNCEVREDYDGGKYMIPSCWPKEYKCLKTTVVFCHGGFMQTLRGKTLEVIREDKGATGMCDARYKAADYWIPNWAIEWVKEEAN